MKNIAQGTQDAGALHTYYAWNEKFYPAQAYRLLGTTNHDKNAWGGRWLHSLSQHYRFRLDVPFDGLSDQVKDLIFYGSKGEKIEHELMEEENGRESKLVDGQRDSRRSLTQSLNIQGGFQPKKISATL